MEETKRLLPDRPTTPAERLAVGRQLIELKAKVGKGGWLPIFEGEPPFDVKSAQRWMNAAAAEMRAERERIEGKQAKAAYKPPRGFEPTSVSAADPPGMEFLNQRLIGVVLEGMSTTSLRSRGILGAILSTMHAAVDLDDTIRVDALKQAVRDVLLLYLQMQRDGVEALKELLDALPDDGAIASVPRLREARERRTSIFLISVMREDGKWWVLRKDCEWDVEDDENLDVGALMLFETEVAAEAYRRQIAHIPNLQIMEASR